MRSQPSNNTLAWHGVLLLSLALIAMLILEHSQWDVAISQLFYSNGQWLLQKGTQPFAWVFYEGPKKLIILLGVSLMLTLGWRYWQVKQTKRGVAVAACRWQLFQRFDNRELLFLLLCLIIVPSVTASLKSVTHVSCPNHLLLFNGEFEYLNIWQNMLAKTPAKCFPAAHASAGFSLYGLAYMPRLRRHSRGMFVLVTVLAWSMGLYKMAIGDHFFSHTLVSMLLSWSLVCLIASVVFKAERS